MTKSEELYERAKRVMPGGVNSADRSYKQVGGIPHFIKKSKGAELFDADGYHYIDYVCSWGAMILGHNHSDIRSAMEKALKNGISFGADTEVELELAELICSTVPSVEMVRMVNSRTEAAISAIRVARGYTGRNKVIEFEGCYHGSSDAMLVKGCGVAQGCAEDTLIACYNDIRSVEVLFEENPEDIAAVIIEPVAASMGVVTPKPGFLQQLRDLCTRHGTVLIFDEFITGYRLRLDGAQGYYGVKPDMTLLGRIVGAGMPIGAYGGKREIMQQVAPLGPVIQNGTLSGNPIAMAAGVEQLKLLKKHQDVYEYLDDMGEYLRKGLRELARNRHIDVTVNGIGSLSSIYFTSIPVEDYDGAKTSDSEMYRKFFSDMLYEGIYLAPSQYEAIFISAAHTERHLDQFLGMADIAFANLEKRKNR